MPRAIILLGPPSIGKSFSLKKVRRKYEGQQILSIDKDVLNKYFFSPTLKKIPGNLSTKILGATTRTLLSEAVTTFQEPLMSGGKDLVIFIQGASYSGIKQELGMILAAGFELDLILLTTDNISIIEKRNKHRAISQGDALLGASEMKPHELREAMMDCNAAFYRMVNELRSKPRTPSIANASSGVAKVSDEFGDEFGFIREHRDKISYSVHLTRTIEFGRDISGLIGDDLEMELTLDVYGADEIIINNSSIDLGKSGVDTYSIHTA